MIKKGALEAETARSVAPIAAVLRTRSVAATIVVVVLGPLDSVVTAISTSNDSAPDGVFKDSINSGIVGQQDHANVRDNSRDTDVVREP